MPSAPSLSTPVTSSLKPAAWRYFLHDYPDRTFVNTLVQIIDNGASLGFIGSDHSQDCKNLRSALEHADTVSRDIASQLAHDRTHGPFPSPPLLNFRCSPLGSVSRKRSSKQRRIHHLSWPRGDSVNDGIPDSEGSIQYELFRHAIQKIQASGPGTLLAKLDLKDAFRHIPVRPTDWHLLGYQWEQQYYYDTVLAFGLKSAPYIFNLFAEALHWVIARHIPGSLQHYLDDFLPIFPPNTPAPLATSAVHWIRGLGSTLSLNFQEEKTVWPTTSLEFLGLVLDTGKMEARLPEDKLEYLKDLLADWADRTSCTLHDLQELTGFLQFASQVIPTSRAFIRRLLDFSTSFSTSSAFSYRHIPSSAKRDIKWWQALATSSNGIHLITPSRRTLFVDTDASGTKGIGGIFGNRWFTSRVARRDRKKHIQYKEMAAVLDAILRWGSEFTGSHVVFRVDNEAVVSALQESTIRSAPTMGLLRLILLLAACLDFTFTSVWISTHENALADASSRFQYTRLFTLKPDLQRQPSLKDPRIKSFITYASANMLVNSDGSILPASPAAVMEWVASLGGRVLPRTIKSYLCHLRSLHVDADLPFSATESPMVQRLLRGIKRYHGERDRKPKQPVTAPVLRDIISTLSPGSPLDDATFGAAFKLAFAAFLRCGEFTVDKEGKFNPECHLSRRCIQFLPSADNPTHLQLTLPSSKTDPFRKGVSILVAAAPSASTCPVSALRDLFQRQPLPADSPLFVTGPTNSPLTRGGLIKKLRECLAAKGYNPTLFSGHSFRRGAASSAAAAGYSEHEIQLLGRWRSDAYKLYIDVPTNRLLHLSSLLHWVQPSAPAFTPPALHFASPLA